MTDPSALELYGYMEALKGHFTKQLGPRSTAYVPVDLTPGRQVTPEEELQRAIDNVRRDLRGMHAGNPYRAETEEWLAGLLERQRALR